MLTSSCHLLRRRIPALCPSAALPNGTTKYPESLCLILALPLSGRRRSPPARTLLPGHRSYGLMRRSHSLSSPSALASCEESLQVATSPCCRRDHPDVISANLSLVAWTPVTAVRGVHVPVSSSTSSAFPRTLSRSASRVSRQNDFLTDRPFRDCSHFFMFRPPGLLAPQIVPTAAAHRLWAAGASVRAEHASLPPHASDITNHPNTGN